MRNQCLGKGLTCAGTIAMLALTSGCAIHVAVSAAPNPADAGQPITYTVTVTNTANCSQTDVSLSALLLGFIPDTVKSSLQQIPETASADFAAASLSLPQFLGDLVPLSGQAMMFGPQRPRFYRAGSWSCWSRCWCWWAIWESALPAAGSAEVFRVDGLAV